MKKKVLILEDILNGVQLIRNILAPEDNIEVIGHARTIAEARHFLTHQSIHPDIVLSDIHFPDGIIFQLFNSLENINFNIIFTTAYSEFRNQAFEYGDIGYLTKPIFPEELLTLINNVSINSPSQKNQIEIVNDHLIHPKKRVLADRIALRDSLYNYYPKINSILYLNGANNTVFFHLENGKRITIAKNIGFFESLLFPYDFFRIDRSILVNRNRVISFKKKDDIVILDNGLKLKVSRRNRTAFLQEMDNDKKTLTY